MLKYESIAELVSEAEKQGIRISEMVMKDQAEAMETTELETFEKMELDFQVMNFRRYQFTGMVALSALAA